MKPSLARCSLGTPLWPQGDGEPDKVQSSPQNPGQPCVVGLLQEAAPVLDGWGVLARLTQTLTFAPGYLCQSSGFLGRSISNTHRTFGEKNPSPLLPFLVRGNLRWERRAPVAPLLLWLLVGPAPGGGRAGGPGRGAQGRVSWLCETPWRPRRALCSVWDHLHPLVSFFTHSDF